MKANHHANTAPIHICLVDDDEDLRAHLKNFLEKNHFHVTDFGDAEKAFQFLCTTKNLSQDSERGPVDALITDFMMPRLTGLELLQKIRGSWPQLPCLMVTADAEFDVALAGVEPGLTDVLLKPLHLTQLLFSLRRLLSLSDLRAENQNLKEAVHKKSKKSSFVYQSSQFTKTLELATRVAKSDATVFIHGESGTGKEMMAQFIHDQSPRSKGPMIALNCSAIPETLLESELFGHAKGSFTGAIDKRVGLFEEADGGTLFLDEIGDLPLGLQAKLLRVLQERKIKRLGENIDRPINVRIISATHRNLQADVQDKKFRQDLFYRLNVIPIKIPALRDRKEDILPLARHFLQVSMDRNHLAGREFSREALEYLLSSDWPGNVRELENKIERAVVLSSDKTIQRRDLEFEFETESTPSKANGAPSFQLENWSDIFGCFDQLPALDRLPSLDTLNNGYTQYVLRRAEGAKEKTARVLGIDRKTLYKKLHPPMELQ